jgi:uncharacterized DUF497 family protein
VTFEWDLTKAAQNRRKHGVSFHEAATAFGDPLSLTYQDPDHSVEEQRFITVEDIKRRTAPDSRPCRPRRENQNH